MSPLWRMQQGLYLAVALLLLSIVGGLYMDLKSAQLHRQNLDIQLGLERMVRLNQSLTGAVAMAVLERNTLRAASYPSLQAELDATMAAMLDATASMALAGDIQALHEEQQALRAVEATVFERMRQESWDLAYQALWGGDHVMALKVYEINSEAAVGALSIELTHKARRHAIWQQVSLALRLTAVALMLLAGWRYARRLQSELAEQSRLRAALAQSNEALEAKVRQRTEDLEQANRQLERLSVTDELTQLANRRRFDVALAQEWQRAQRRRQSLALIMLDVDHFKAYNDRYGHQAGDACLQQIAAVLRSCARRAGDLAARYGGEEFVVMLPDADVHMAAAVAQSIRESLLQAALPHASSPVAPVVTVSLGVAACVPPGEASSEPLLRQADTALYEAKSQGRNRLILASPA